MSQQVRSFFDHVEFYVGDYQKSFKFYSACLPCMGFSLVVCDNDKGVFGFGLNTGKSPDLLLTAGHSTTPAMHLCFSANFQEQVDEFYRKAVAAGGTCNGPPGLRHAGYYAAFVLDPDGHNIEAVFRGCAM